MTGKKSSESVQRIEPRHRDTRGFLAQGLEHGELALDRVGRLGQQLARGFLAQDVPLRFRVGQEVRRVPVRAQRWRVYDVSSELGGELRLSRTYD